MTRCCDNISLALFNAHEKCMMTMYEAGERFECNKDATYLAAAFGTFRQLEFVCDNGGIWDSNIILHAVVHRKYNILQYAYQKKYEWHELAPRYLNAKL